MSIAQYILLGYGVLLLAGAYFGVKAGSKVSLIMGIISGTLVCFGRVLNNTKEVQGKFS